MILWFLIGNFAKGLNLIQTLLAENDFNSIFQRCHFLDIYRFHLFLKNRCHFSLISLQPFSFAELSSLSENEEENFSKLYYFEEKFHFTLIHLLEKGNFNLTFFSGCFQGRRRPARDLHQRRRRPQRSPSAGRGQVPRDVHPGAASHS